MTGNTFFEIDDRFLSAVRESYSRYNQHGARSNEKLRPIHQWLADEMLIALGQGCVVKSLRTDSAGGEETIPGKYYDKKVDIAISKEDGAPLAIISVKFITSNFKQNANNYFEHLMGETANIRRAEVGFGHFMVLPAILPYLTKGGTITRTEVIGDHHLQKYANLEKDDDYPHKPDVIGIVIISLPKDLQNADEIELKNLEEMQVSEAVRAALYKFSPRSFIQKMKTLVEAKG